MIFAQLSKRERLLFIITSSIIIAALLVNFAVIPLGNKWHRLNSQIMILNTKLNRYKRVLGLKKHIETRYLVYGDFLKVKGSNEEAQANVLQEIEGVARKAGVILTNIIPANLENKDFYRRFNIRIELEAEILPLSRFLYEIQKSKQLLGIERLNIATKSGSPGLLRCSIQVTKVFVP